jgi:hypothetical protein
MHEYDETETNMPSKYPCVVTVQQTYAAARDELGDDYNESDEDGLLGIIGESITTMVLHSPGDVPKGYVVTGFDEEAPTDDYE